MAFSGSVFARLYSWVSDAAAGIPIDATRMDADSNDIATGLSGCIQANGNSTVTADLPMASHTLTGVRAAIANGEPVIYDQVSVFAGAANLIRNGGFNVMQRPNTAGVFTGTTAGLYTLDGWFARRDGATAGYTVQQWFGTGVPNTAAFFALALQRTAADANPAFLFVAQTIDTFDVQRTQNVPGTSTDTLGFSVGVTKGANFTGTGVKAALYGSATAGQNPITGSGWTLINSTTIAAANIALGAANTPTLLAVSGSLIAVAYKSLCIRLSYEGPTGAAGAVDTLYFTQAVMVRGTATPSFVAAPFAAELARCQRHYWKSFPYLTSPAQSAGRDGALEGPIIIAGATATQTASMFYPVPLAQAPATITYYNPSAANAFVRNQTLGTDATVTTTSVGNSTRSLAIGFTGLGPWAVNNVYSVHVTVDADY